MSGLEQKLARIKAAAAEQLPPEEYATMLELLKDFQQYGMTARINKELGTIMSKVQWELPEAESPEWSEALQACDFKFLGAELKAMCRDLGMNTGAHKKELCRRLYKARQPDVMAVMDPYLKAAENSEEDKPTENSSEAFISYLMEG